MKIGVVFPRTEIGADPGAVRTYAEAVSDLGYNHLLAYDHCSVPTRSAHRLERPVRPAQHVSRAVGPLRLLGSHLASRARDRDRDPSSATDSARRRNRRQRSTSSREVAFVSASGSAGTPSSTRRSARTSRTRPTHRRAGRADAPAVDGGVGDFRGQVRDGDRRRPRPLAGPAADPDLVRSHVHPGAAARRSARGWLVPADRPPDRSSTRPCSVIERAAHRSGAGPRSNRHGGLRQRRRRRSRHLEHQALLWRSAPSDPPLARHHGSGSASTWTITWRSLPRPPGSSSTSEHDRPRQRLNGAARPTSAPAGHVHPRLERAGRDRRFCQPGGCSCRSWRRSRPRAGPLAWREQGHPRRRRAMAAARHL